MSGIEELERQFIRAGDRRAVFASAYLVTTQTVAEWIQAGHFRSKDVALRYVVAFSNAWRDALEEEEHHGRPPEAWRMAFATAHLPESTVIENLMLGINAHINHDLAFSALKAGLDTRCDCCAFDHSCINDALRAAAPRVRRRVSHLHAPAGSLAGALMGAGIDRHTMRSFMVARHHAWISAKALQAAPTQAARAAVAQAVSRRAARAAQLIQQHPRLLYPCLDALADAGGVTVPSPDDDEVFSSHRCAAHRNA
ncbi:MAG: DUF5995 family protein [Verrucomicrobiaceae bacterium]